VSAFGNNLATSTESARSVAFPTSLAGTTATFVDSSNTTYPVALSFVSSGQVNYMVPSAARPGAATLTLTSANGATTSSVVLVSAVDPGLYAANANGKGVPAGFAVCAGDCPGWPNRQANRQFVQDLFTCGGAGGCVPERISLGEPSDTVVLELFGTGLRHVTWTSAVTATINDKYVPVEFAGAQGRFTGEDQINVQIPHNFAGSGAVSLVITTSVSKNALAPYDNSLTVSSNTVSLDIQ